MLKIILIMFIYILFISTSFSDGITGSINSSSIPKNTTIGSLRNSHDAGEIDILINKQSDIDTLIKDADVNRVKTIKKNIFPNTKTEKSDSINISNYQDIIEATRNDWISVERFSWDKIGENCHSCIIAFDDEEQKIKYLQKCPYCLTIPDGPSPSSVSQDGASSSPSSKNRVIDFSEYWKSGIGINSNSCELPNEMKVEIKKYYDKIMAILNDKSNIDHFHSKIPKDCAKKQLEFLIVLHNELAIFSSENTTN